MKTTRNILSALLLAAFTSLCYGQGPAGLPLLTGPGAPTSTCSKSNKTQEYKTTSSPVIYYTCDGTSWKIKTMPSPSGIPPNSPSGIHPNFTGPIPTGTLKTHCFVDEPRVGTTLPPTIPTTAIWINHSCHLCALGDSCTVTADPDIPINLAVGDAGGVTGTLPISNGGTGATTAPAALTALGAAPAFHLTTNGTGAATYSNNVINIPPYQTATNTGIGPLFNVLDYEGTSPPDDTTAIQAAFNACAGYNSTTGILGGATGGGGGVVQFPSGHSYKISKTINAFDGCHIESIATNANSPVRIDWVGAAAGTVITLTDATITVAANTTPIYAPAFPQISSGPQNRTPAYIATVTAGNSLNLNKGDWIEFSGLTSPAGTGGLNRCIAQVASSSGSSFVAVIPCSINPATAVGTFTDSGTVTKVNVALAFDAQATFEQEVKGISVVGTTPMNVGIYFGAHTDTGTRIYDTQVAFASEYGYYFADGGINTEFDKGWRCDATGISCIYWRTGGNDNLGIANGTTPPANAGGGAVTLDNSQCGQSHYMHFTARNIYHELDAGMNSGLGIYTLYDCGYAGLQFYLDLENVWVSSGGGINQTAIAMIPANDAALSLSIVNGNLGAGSAAGRWSGLLNMVRNDLAGGVGTYPSLAYTPPFTGFGVSSGIIGAVSPSQVLGDLNITRLYQYGLPASDFLYADTDFTAQTNGTTKLPNGTTLYAGQILAPPSYWSGANSTRYAMDVVYQTGTTGTPNKDHGGTTCATPTFTITGVSVSNNIATFTGTTNGLWNGTQPYISDTVLFPSGTPSYSIIGNSLTSSSTSFSIAYTHANINQTADAGTATQGYELVCNSPTDLSMGQQLLNPSYTAVGYGIVQVDATYPSSVYLRVAGNISGGFSTPATLNFFHPVLGPELQLPTKFLNAPSSTTAQTWSPGDMEQYSKAAANGVAAWVNVAAGTPGTWAGIPLGDSNGKIATSQIAPPAFSSAVPSPSNSVTLATNGAAFTNWMVTLSNSSTTTINVTGLVNGASFNLELMQDSHGGNRITLGTGCIWLGGGISAGYVASTPPALSTAAGGINVLSAIFDGRNCLYTVR